MRSLSSVIVLAWLPLFGSASHSPLLPRPQRIEYSGPSIPLAQLAIRIEGTPTIEDKFAASELQRLIAQRTGIHLAENQSGPSGQAIVLRRTGPVDALPMPNELPGPDSREAYHLEVGASGVVIQSRSSAGVFYGVQTLAQLVEGEGRAAVLPGVRVDDWPSLAFRGTMVDMSEGQLATEQEVKRQLDHLARWKANQYYFYNEDSIQLDGYPLLNPGARFSKDQIRDIIAYARERHIDVVPCLELYGHQHDLFQIEKYSDLADFPHGGEFNAANPQVSGLLDDWIDQYSALFPSRFVHIGFDETWDIERAAKKEGRGSTPARLFVEQLNHVAGRFQRTGRVVMAWADIMVRFPDIIPELPKGLIAVPWFYEPDPDPEYKKWLDPLAARSVPLIVAPGVSMFTEVSPDFDKSFRNIDTFLAAGRRCHTLGLINTFWTDDQQALRRTGWPGMAYGAAAAWQTDPMDHEGFFGAYAAIVSPASAASHFAVALEKLASAETALQEAEGTDTMEALWQSPFRPEEWDRLQKHRDNLRQARLLAEDAQEQLAAALAVGADPEMLRSLVFVARLLDYAGMRGLYAVEIGELWKQQNQKNGGDEDLWQLISGAFSHTHGRVGDIMDTLSLLKPLYRENWLAEYTPWRLETAMLHWDMEYQFWWHCQERYERYHAAYKPGATLPPIDSVMGEY